MLIEVTVSTSQSYHVNNVSFFQEKCNSVYYGGV